MPTGRRFSPAARPPQSARSLALAVLIGTVTSKEAVDTLLDRALSSSRLCSRDRGLAAELSYGVLRRLATLDWHLEPRLDRPLRRLPLLVQMVLRLGAYQILLLDRIPQSAAVHESVQLAKAHAQKLGRDWSGFVNAVLRALIREPVRSYPPLDIDPKRSLSVRHSVPEWLVRRWIDRLGIAKAEAACEAASSIPPVTLRVNRLKTTREAYLELLRQAGIAGCPTSVSPAGVALDGSGSISMLPGFEEGLFYVEDEAAQLIPPLLDPRPGDVILDACSAPGGKATHVAELIQDRGTVYALDTKGTRLDLLRSNCARLGLKSVVPIVGDARDPSGWTRAVATASGGMINRKSVFDRILVDAPCSGLGVLRRHPEAKWRKTGADFPRHHELQVRILDSVAPSLRPGGVLVYSTCSTEPEETTSVIEQFLSSHAGFRRESVGTWLPLPARVFLTELGDFLTAGNHVSMDGFFAARFRKQD